VTDGFKGLLFLCLGQSLLSPGGTVRSKPASAVFLSIHVSGRLSPLDLLWVIHFLFEGSGCSVH